MKVNDYPIFKFVDSPELRKLCLGTIEVKEIKAKIKELDFREFCQEISNVWKQQELKDFTVQS